MEAFFFGSPSSQLFGVYHAADALCDRYHGVVLCYPFGQDDLANKWRQLDGFQYRHVPAEHDWNYVDRVGGILLPQPVLQQITEWV